MQYINSRLEPDRVHRPVCVTVMTRNYLKNACAQTLETLGVAVLKAGLCLIQSEADSVLRGDRESF